MIPQVVFANVFEVNWTEFHLNNNWQKAQEGEKKPFKLILSLKFSAYH